MLDEENVKLAVSAAANILTFSENSEGRLREKLQKKGFDDEVIDVAFEKLRDLGLLDDRRLLLSTAEYIANRKLLGRGRIKPELIKRGFERRMIDELLDEALEDVDFKENCHKLVIKKRLDKKLLNKETANNAAAALVRYGYNYGEIKYAIQCIKKDT